MKPLDPVQLEVIRNALVAAAEEMGVTIWRTSRSSVVRDLLDYSTCVFDAEGKSVAQATCIPVHLNSMSSCLDDILRDRQPEPSATLGLGVGAVNLVEFLEHLGRFES